MNGKPFWIAQNLALLVLYGAASVLCSTGQSGHLVVLLATVVLVAHVLEIPVAFKVLKDRKPAALRVILGTFLFGFTWWLPAKRGIYPVR